MPSPNSGFQLRLTYFQVANKKQADNAASDAEMKQRREDLARDQENQAPEENQGPTDLLAAEEDEDVIF